MQRRMTLLYDVQHGEFLCLASISPLPDSCYALFVPICMSIENDRNLGLLDTCCVLEVELRSLQGRNV